MTAVLSTADSLCKDRHMSLDDNQINYSPSSTDWRSKYNEVADMLAETRAELDEFHHASKELEAELENELQRTEKAQQDLKVKAIRAESERDEWKSKFMSLQTNHNTTTASLQRELDQLRQDFQQAKIQLRDLEMGNDDLERNERAVSSSLADMEAKYSRALEEKILLEQDLLEKASLEEDSQRLRDELRDANVEISILKDQIASLTAQLSKSPIETTPPQESQTDFPQLSSPSNDDLLSTSPPNLQLDELSNASDSQPSDNSSLQATPKGPAARSSQPTINRVGLQPNKSRIATPPSHPRVTRSTTLPSLYSSSPRTPTTRPAVKSINASTRTASATSAISKSKGVQMVSEMRARVRNLEQKIHTRVPRLRMGSINTRPNPNSLTFAGQTSTSASSTSSSSNKSSVAKTGWDSFRRSGESARNNDSGPEKNQKANRGDSSGWVLIMEDSPSPLKEREKRRMSISSPSHVPTSFRPAASTTLSSPTIASHQSNPFAQSVAPTTASRRPHSRLSAGSLSTTTTNSIPTPTSRPATPTFLPLPSTGLYAHSSTAGITGLKLPSGPGGSNSNNQTKRSSLGANAAISSFDSRPTTLSPRPLSGTPSSSTKFNEGKALPQLPGLHANITMRSTHARPPSSGPSTPGLAQSRIGRPTSGLSGRKSTDGVSGLKSETLSRMRSGSTTSPPS